MVGKRFITVVSATIVMSLAAAACSSDSDSNGDAGGGDAAAVAGTLVVSGSSTVEPITSLVAEKFVAENPEVEPSVDGPGTSDGFELFCNGETDIQDASRPIDEEEVAACAENDISFTELEVALDGLSVIGNPANPLTCLAIGDLYALFGPESSKFERWSEANDLAEEVGGNGGFPDEDLVIVAPGEESGTYGSFIDLAIGDIAEERGKPDDQLRSGYQSSGDDNVIVDNAAGTTGALGFVGLSFALNAGESIRQFGVDAGDGCVTPSNETVVDGSYPLSRSLYIYVSNSAAADNPVVKPFIDFYLSEDGLASVEEVQYVSLPEDRIAATRSAWESMEAMGTGDGSPESNG
jgi:phosphate transport system substrate-binding protein